MLDALPACTAVVESDREVEPPEGWRVLRSRRYGGSVVLIIEKSDRDEHGQTAAEDRS